MRGQDLLDVLEHIQPELIEDANRAPIRRVNRWLGLAAMFVLILGIGAVGAHFVKNGNIIAGREAGAPPPYAAEKAEGNLKEQIAFEPDSPEDSSEIREQLLSMTLGGLRLGMTEEEVKNIVGEPTGISNSGPIKDYDGNSRVCWFYISNDPAYGTDLSLDMIDTGDGWIVNSIMAFASSDFALSNGIHIGSSLAEVEAVYGEDYCEDMNDQIYYCLGDSLNLSISLTDEKVQYIYLGELIPESWNLEEIPQDPPPYMLCGDPITVYERTQSGWSETERTGKDAKRVEVTMNIMELEPYEGAEDRASYVVDFRNGTVAVLYADDESGAIYTTDSFDPKILNTEDWEDKLTLQEKCFFPEGTWDIVAGKN